MLGHGVTLLNDQTYNQEALDYQSEPVEGFNTEQVFSGELNEQLDVDYRVEKTEKFNLKNGCCRECMKAFSMNKKVSNQYKRTIFQSCLCQVPRLQRRATLPVNGCKICNCKGCNPIDVRRDKRNEIKSNLQKEGKLVQKRQRLLDSDDEDLPMRNKFDEWNKAKKDFGVMIQNLSQLDMFVLGIGMPSRHPSYILGRQVNQGNDEKECTVGSVSIGAKSGNSYAEHSLDNLSDNFNKK